MGKSNDQVIGYKYFTNFLLFIGNPIEKMLGINFDKRGWLTGERASHGDGEMIYIEAPNLYGETEGGVSGVMNLKYGTNSQTTDETYKAYMESIGLQASAYPYQSYISFGGGGLDGIVPGSNAFYVGNSGYMKEMLLWPKRTRIRNDGRRQWYEVRGDGATVCEIASHNTGINSAIEQPTPLNTVTGRSEENWYNSPSEARLSSDSGEFNEVILQNDIWGELDLPGSNIQYGFSPENTPLVRDFQVDISSGSGLVVLVVSASFGSVGQRPFDEGLFQASFFGPVVNIEKNIVNRSVIWKVSVERPALVVGRITCNLFKDSDGGSFAYFMNHETRIIGLYQKPKCIDSEIQGIDINPIHKIREILTDDTAMNKPESSVNNDNFIKAADRIYGEGLGVSWSITEKSCIDAINELCYHIEAGIRVNRQTGLYEIVLFRDNWFEENEIHTISESKIKSMQYEITNADEVINQVNVNFYDRDNIKNSSFSISESGLIQTLGRVNAETVDFPYFMNMRNAEIVANWKLKILSTGVYKGTFTTGWREARKWNRYDLIKLPWSKRWSGTILVRIMSINLGGPTNNEVSIDFIEVVPSTGMMNTTIVADDVIDKPLPPQSCQYEPFELPYYLAVMALGQRKTDEELAYDSNFGLVGVVAEKPQENSLYAVMMTNNYDEWVRAGSIQYSLTADSDQIISKTSSSFTVKNWKKISNVPVGTLIQCGKEWLTGLSEWMIFQGVDANTGVVSVKRGALDTQPQDWDLGLKLYFCGTDVTYDATEYVSGEKVLVSALTTTPSGVLEQKGSNAIEMKARAIRPYPPANVKINGEYWLAEIETDLILTWVGRNRLQQTGGGILGWFDDGVAIESGTQTHLILTQLDESNLELATTNTNVTGATSYTMPISSMQADARTVEIVLKTVRDGYECLNPFVHKVELSQFFSAPYDLTVEYIP